MAKNLVIVESPAKAKTLKKFLGSNYKIVASVGHIRDLPKSYLGIDVDNDFAMKYITIRGKKEVITKLKQEVKTADKIYLATDPDREGEAISWHLFELLNLSHENTKRITFNEITKTAVKASIKNARDIDMDLVNAQQARRALDRIVGYKISPILWKKVRGGLSAGRVQSVAVKMICDREAEREKFIPEEYWTIEALFKNKLLANFFGDVSGKIDLKTQTQVDEIVSRLQNEFVVTECKDGTRSSKPSAPFTTSTLQQEASKLLNFNTSRTMRIAQQLYEGVNIANEGTVGLISYIRTDSVRISDEAQAQAKDYITNAHGEEYFKYTVYKSKGKAQDAHEAIRPTYVKYIPDEIKESLTPEQYKLYKLIWQRFVASQMSPAIYKTQTLKLKSNDYIFKSTGSVLEFDGYLKIYGADKLKETTISNLSVGDKLTVKQITPKQHFTEPSPRFTEAMLVKTLEELGIGRPSTYSAIITNIQQRNYVAKEAKAFYPTELGKIVNELLDKNFNDIVNAHFTANMEEQLDKVATGDVQLFSVLKNFYEPFELLIQSATANIEKIKIADEESDEICDKCGEKMLIKLGKYGKFLACSGFPNCRNAKPILQVIDEKCPKCSGDVVVKKTRKGRKFFACQACEYMSWSKPGTEQKK